MKAIVQARTDSEVRIREAGARDRAVRAINQCFELQAKSAEQKASCDRLVERLTPKAGN